jgi:hypothetical protein
MRFTLRSKSPYQPFISPNHYWRHFLLHAAFTRYDSLSNSKYRSRDMPDGGHSGYLILVVRRAMDTNSGPRHPSPSGS